MFTYHTAIFSVSLDLFRRKEKKGERERDELAINIASIIMSKKIKIKADRHNNYILRMLYLNLRIWKFSRVNIVYNLLTLPC